MQTAQPTEPYLIYLDTSALVDMADKTEPRHNKARRLLGRCRKYEPTGRIILYTSVWAVSEAKGVIYGELVKQNIGLKRLPQNRNVRDIIPPRASDLASADTKINNLLQELSQLTRFELWPPPGLDNSAVWYLSARLAQEAAIWPPDAIHLSIALYTGCSMFVSDDQNLLEKIDCCYSSLILPYRETAFSLVPNLPPFRYCGVEDIVYKKPGQVRRRIRRAAIHTLSELGFV